VNVFFYLYCWHTVEVSEDSRHKNKCKFPSTGPYIFISAFFVMRAMSCCWCHVWSGCEYQQWAKVHAVQRTCRYNIHDQPRRLSTPFLSEVHHMIPVQESLIVCQYFEQQAKLVCSILYFYSPFIVAHAAASPANISPILRRNCQDPGKEITISVGALDILYLGIYWPSYSSYLRTRSPSTHPSSWNPVPRPLPVSATRCVPAFVFL